MADFFRFSPFPAAQPSTSLPGASSGAGRAGALVLTLALLALVPLSGCKAKAPLAADQPVPVALRAPLLVHQPEAITVSGTVEANVTAANGFQIAGRVARVYVEEGQAVKKGQLLAELDSADYRNGYEAARGQAVAAEAQATKADNGPRPQELEQARIDFEQRQDEYQRLKFLYEHQSLPANDFHKIEAAYQAARERYQMAREGARHEDRQAAQGQSHAARAQMQEASKRLADCQLRSPIAGYVALKRVDVGSSVTASEPAIVVVDLNPAKIRTAIPEASIGKLKVGSPAAVTLPALGGKSFAGKVELIGVSADPAARTYNARLMVANPNLELRAGMVAEARIEGPAMVDALTVPGSAVVHDEHGVAQLYVYDPARQRAYARRVELGRLIGQEVEITSGITAADRIVIAGEQKLREGSPVAVVGGAK